jgi:hypothetical protein
VAQKTAQAAAAESEEEATQAKEVDRIISEIAGLAGRWGLFRRFLVGRLKVRFTRLGHEGGLLTYIL